MCDGRRKPTRDFLETTATAIEILLAAIAVVIIPTFIFAIYKLFQL